MYSSPGPDPVVRNTLAQRRLARSRGTDRHALRGGAGDLQYSQSLRHSRDRDRKYVDKEFAGFGMDFEAFQPASRFWTVLRDAEEFAHEPGCFGKLRRAS